MAERTHRIDHPQYHPTVYKAVIRVARRKPTEKDVWRNGVRVYKR
jgi:hypothetical protein